MAYLLSSYLSPLASLVLGDSSSAALYSDPRTSSYEDVHADVQSILLPPILPRGLSVIVLQPLNKNFALQHKVRLEPGALQPTPFGPQAGPGSRFYSLGGVLTHAPAAGAPPGAKLRLAAQVDVENSSGRSSALADVWGDGRLRLQAHLADARGDAAGTQWSLAATLRGDDFVSVARLKHGPEAGLSYNQRLAPGSPLTLGGEMVLSAPSLMAAAGYASAAGAAATAGAAAAPPPRRPLEWAVGAAYDAGLHKSALHVASTGSFSAVLSLHHLVRVTERAALAAKFMLSPASGGSMAAAGYRLRFRNTQSTLHGMVDSYGTVKVVVEREPLRDVRVAASLEARLSPAASKDGPDGAASFGFSVSLGAPAPFSMPLSPCTMTCDIFGPQF